MKKLTAILGVCILICTPVMAEQTSVDHFDQAGIVYDHSHSVDTTTGSGIGIGADVVVYKSSNPLIEEVTIENRYDVDNQEFRIFGVVRVDLFEKLAGK